MIKANTSDQKTTIKISGTRAEICAELRYIARELYRVLREDRGDTYAKMKLHFIFEKAVSMETGEEKTEDEWNEEIVKLFMEEDR